MSTFAYFGRPKGKISTQQYIVAMVQDAKDWLKRSKLPRREYLRGVKDDSFLHEAMHQLIDPLKQPTAIDIDLHIARYGSIPKNQKGRIRNAAYYQLQRSNRFNRANMELEYKVAGLEGRKPGKAFNSVDAYIALEPGYWQGRRARKSFTKQHMAAANLMDIAYTAKKTPQLFKAEDLELIQRAYRGLTTNQENSYLLRTYGKLLRRS